jgi:signal transduction histidine kinase
MRKANPNRALNWTTVLIRLGFLVAAGLWVHYTIPDGFTWPVIIVLGLESSAAIISMALAGLSYHTQTERLLTLLADIVFAYFMFYLTGPTRGNMGWLGLLPVLTAGFFFQWVGALIVGAVTVVIQGGLAYLDASLSVFFLQLVILLVLYIAFGSLAVSVVPVLMRAGTASRNSRLSVRGVSPEHERQTNIFKMISTLSSTLNYQRVLEMALDLSSSTLSQMNAPAAILKSAVLLFTEVEKNVTELQISTSRGLLPQDLRAPLPGRNGLLGKTIETGQSVLSKDVKQDPELGRLVGLHGCRSAYCIPLRAGLDTYGILLFIHPDVEFFSPDRVEILDIVGNQAMIALQNARLYQDLAQEKERVTEIQEESRKKLARDLHDGPTQSIAAIGMRVNFARRLMERDTKAAAEELYKIEELARRTTKEIRHMLFTLRPLVLESRGLVAALESMAEKMHETYDQQVTIQADQRVVDQLEMGKQAVVFYIAEEAVNNARKHAQAEQVSVRLKLLRDELSLLEIEDNGVGFNVNQVDSSYENRGSLGMVNMRERTELVNGMLRIDSAPGRGTRIQVLIPLSEEAEDRLRRGT